MKVPRIIKLKKFTSDSGSLLPITLNKKFPINVKRIFFIFGKKNFKRGDHAHKKCSQLFIAIAGRIKIQMKYRNNTKNILLNSNVSRGILLPPMIWCNVKFLVKNSVLLVLNDYEYEYKDYIETYDEFLKLQKKKK